MLHDYLYQDPVQARKQPGRRGKGVTGTPSEKKEESLITEVVTRAKRLQRSVVEELVYYGVNILEVTV